MKKWEIWLADLPGGMGHEQKGLRPALVAGAANGMVLAIPFTTNTNSTRFSYAELMEPCSENGLTEDSVALVFQLSSCDERRFKRKLGFVPEEDRGTIESALIDLLEMKK